MSKQVTFKVEERTRTGKGAMRRLRAAGKVPGNVYGHGREPVAVEADEHELSALIGGISVENTLIELQVGKAGAKPVLIREIQRHPYRSRILHVDFFEITAGESIRVAVPIRLEGTPAGVKTGGILQVIRHELEIECLPADIPEEFVIDVSELLIGDSVHVRDLDTGDVVEVLEDEGMTVCTVVAPRVLAVEEEEEAAEVVGEEEEVEPEVITARGGEAGEDEEDE